MQAFFTKNTAAFLAGLVLILTAALHTAAFPFAFVSGRTLSVAEAGYVCLAPLAVWLMRRRRVRMTALVAWGAFFLSWLFLLSWLRHVTYFGTIGLSAVLALFPLGWALGARVVLPDLPRRSGAERILVIAGLAGLWVILEWARSWVLSGFPWLPLAASQWDRPAMLQILPFTGYLGLSWVLAFFSLALASYLLFILHPKKDAPWWKRFNPELYAGLFMLLACALSVALMVRTRSGREPLFQAGLVQPYLPGMLKWDPEVAGESVTRLERLSTFAQAQGAEVIFWPESALPWPVVGSRPDVETWCDDLSARLKTPIVMGGMAEVPAESGPTEFFNGVLVVDPETKLAPVFYAKRKLVPFGEYNPLAFLTDNFLKLPYDFFTPGRADQSGCLTLAQGGHLYKAGALVCYEDIFPALARGEAAAGADFFYVATNNAWYGEEAGAYQHAAHSVLRAVENRRPVLRCGNGGWSGFIDEYGAIEYVCERPGQGVYFQGEDVFPLKRVPAFAGSSTTYTRHGDWVVWPSLVLAAAAFFVTRREPPQATTEPEEELPPDDGLSPERRKARELLGKGKFRIGRRLGGSGRGRLGL
jgi:apolipoprotein N-acyltransferase